GIKMVHVPYRGGAPAVLDTVAGQTQLLFSAGTQTLGHVKEGRLNPLGVTEGRRSRLLPEVPTVAETVPGYEMAVWYGALGPKGMPRDLAARLNAEINGALLLPEVRDKMAGIGVEVANETPEAFAAALRADAEKWGKAIRELGISMSEA
ncbi:MAG TPA: tripartite tricarboxylate transporter substrate-binding protein, partial [Actinomycetota bacterium]